MNCEYIEKSKNITLWVCLPGKIFPMKKKFIYESAQTIKKNKNQNPYLLDTDIFYN